MFSFFSAAKIPETDSRRTGTTWRFYRCVRTARKDPVHRAWQPAKAHGRPSAAATVHGESDEVLCGDRAAAGVHNVGRELAAAADLH
jgi:hypothetical protein